MNLELSRINHYIDEELPDIELFDINRKVKKLSDFNKKVILLDFWATWCGPCVANIPHQIKVYESLKAYGIVDFEWIKISVDKDTSNWKNMVILKDIPGINLVGKREEIEKAYHIKHYPTYVLIDGGKKVLGFDISGPDAGITLDWLIILGLNGVNCVDAWRSFYTPGIDSIKENYVVPHQNYFIKNRNR